jgi:Protein of unknown function (DUF2905)
MDISRFLILLGLVVLVAGLLWPLLSKLGIGRLPGDIVLEGENYTFYFPLVTGLLIGLTLSVVLWLFAR